MPGPLKLVGAGRHADVYDLGDGRVLRRYRDAAAMADREAEVMVHALSHGVPVPEVFDVSGADMVMEHAVGLTMLQDITRRPWALDRHARLLAALHSTVHAVPALNWLRAPFGDGTVLLHTDLHPGNVILTKAGPRLIDWQGAARGPAEADIALTWVLVATSQVPGPLVQRAVGRAGQALFARRYLAAAQPGAGLGLAGAPLPRRAAGAVPRPAGRSFRPPSPAVGVNSRVHGGHRATAAAPTIVSFGLCQLCAQAFLALEGTLTWTVIAEELPARSRGFGFGVLAMLDALGAGTGALAWGLLLSPHHLSWRWLYVAATPVLLIVAFMRRRLPESSRFQAAASAGRLAASWRSLLRPPHGRLLVLVCAASVLGGLLAQASVFVIDFVQTQRHLSASAANLILVGAGALAIPVLVGAGGISDRLGRKRIGCSFLALSVAGTLCFFFLARGPAGLFLALAIIYVGQFGAWPTLTGFSTELFPTSHRALASSAAGIARVAGTCISFVLAALLIGLTGSLARSVALLAAGPLLALVIVAVGLPETAGRELEQTSAEFDGAALPGPIPAADPVAQRDTAT